MLSFNIHGVIVNVYNGSKKIRNYFQKELGYFLSEENQDPDIQINFVSNLAIPSKLKSIGRFAEFGQNKFYVRFQASRVLLPVNNIGKTVKIKSELSIPLKKFLESILEPIIYFKLLTKNFAFIHSSAVSFNKNGIIFPAWTHAGKTELLFEFMKRGANFMSDDWTFVSDSGRIYAYPRPIRIHSHTFLDFSKISGKSSSTNFILRRNKFSWRPNTSKLKKPDTISYNVIFPNVLTQKECNLGIIVHLLRYKGKEIVIVEEDPDLIIEKTLSIIKFARLHYILPLYALYKFAFPKNRNNVIETAEEVERRILKKAFNGKPIYSLKIPLIANPSDVYNILLETILKT